MATCGKNSPARTRPESNPCRSSQNLQNAHFSRFQPGNGTIKPLLHNLVTRSAPPKYEPQAKPLRGQLSRACFVQLSHAESSVLGSSSNQAQTAETIDSHGSYIAIDKTVHKQGHSVETMLVDVDKMRPHLFLQKRQDLGALETGLGNWPWESQFSTWDGSSMGRSTYQLQDVAHPKQIELAETW